MVRFSGEEDVQLTLPVPLFDPEEAAHLLLATGQLHREAVLTLSPTLYQREDLFEWAPPALSAWLSRHVLLQAAPPTPLPLQVGRPFRARRTVVLFIVGAARLALGHGRLFDSPGGAPSATQALEVLVQRGLERAGLANTSVEVFAAGSLAGLYLMNHPAVEAQAFDAARRGLDLYGIREARLRIPLPGYYELWGRREAEFNMMLLPSFVSCEPPGEIWRGLKHSLARLQLPLRASETPVMATGGQLH